jgi:hypothetical protein
MNRNSKTISTSPTTPQPVKTQKKRMKIPISITDSDPDPPSLQTEIDDQSSSEYEDILDLKTLASKAHPQSILPSKRQMPSHISLRSRK